MNNKDISIRLSIFIVIAGAIGIFSIAGSDLRITGFSVYNINSVGSLGIGTAALVFFIITTIIALANLAYLERMIR
jgi:hypothetical protein